VTITILKTEQFQPLGKPLPRPAAPAPEPVQIKPGIWKNPDGRLETRNPAVDLIVNGGGKPAPKVTPATIGVDLAAGADQTCITVWELSRELGVKGSEVLIALMRYGQQFTLNQAIDGDLADLVREELAETPFPVLPNALSDGWIQCSEDMPNLPYGTYEYRNNGSSKHTRPLATNLRDLIGPSGYSYRQYRLLPQGAA